MIEAFIFDMDGLLVDSETVHVLAFEGFMRAKGIDAPPGYADTLVGYSVARNIERLKREFGLSGDTQALVEERNALYLDMLLGGPLAPLPGVAEVFDFAQRHGLRRAVCSSSERRQLDAVLPRLLASLSREPEPRAFFDAIVCGEDVEHAKPAPDLYLLSADRLRLPPERCLAFEDSVVGAQSAAAAGMPLVVVPNRFVPAGTVWPTPRVVASLGDALEHGIVTAGVGRVELVDE